MLVQFLEHATEETLPNTKLLEATAANIKSHSPDRVFELISNTNKRDPQIINSLTEAGDALLILAASTGQDDAIALQMCNLLLTNGCQQLDDAKGRTVGDVLRKRNLGNSDAAKIIDTIIETRLKLSQQQTLIESFLAQVEQTGLPQDTLLPLVQNILSAPAAPSTPPQKAPTPED